MAFTTVYDSAASQMVQTTSLTLDLQQGLEISALVAALENFRSSMKSSLAEFKQSVSEGFAEMTHIQFPLESKFRTTEDVSTEESAQKTEIKKDSPQSKLESPISGSPNVSIGFTEPPIVGKIKPCISPLVARARFNDRPSRMVDDDIGLVLVDGISDTQLFDPGGTNCVKDCVRRRLKLSIHDSGMSLKIENALNIYGLGVEKDINEVLQSHIVYSNVSNGVLAKSKDLIKTFGSDDHTKICLEILDKGELQVAGKERESQFSSQFQDIATVIMQKTINTETQRPYTISMVKRLMHEIHFSVDPHRNSKKQALAVIIELQKHFPIQCSPMRVCLTVPVQNFASLRKKLQEWGACVVSKDESGTQMSTVYEMGPGPMEDRLEILIVSVQAEGDTNGKTSLRIDPDICLVGEHWTRQVLLMDEFNNNVQIIGVELSVHDELIAQVHHFSVGSCIDLTRSCNSPQATKVWDPGGGFHGRRHFCI